MELTLKPGALYEIAFVDAALAKDALSTYFGPLADEAKALGATGLATLNITHIEHGDFNCKTVAICGWPSTEAYFDFHRRETWPAEILKGRHSIPMQVASETAIHLTKEGRYEFAAFWMNREKANLTAEYFETMGPLIKPAGPRPLIDWSVGAPKGPLAMNPTRFNWIEWTGTPEARAAMFTSDEFKSSGYLRALALDRIVTMMVSPAK